LEELSIGQVVLASFPFSDLSAKKMRPCFVIGIAEFDDIVLCQITSQNYGSSRAIALLKNDFAMGSIVADSFIRPDKIATLDRSTIKKVLGLATEHKVREVKEGLKSFLQIP
jgi:mRNA-degrading endonuclease toxin of MazEF toxin-antitoxin module